MTGPNPTPLATRLEEAEASRELDAEISVALKVVPPGATDQRWVREWSGPWAVHHGRVALCASDGHINAHYAPAPLTSSLDAALALVGEKLPGKDLHWEIGTERSGYYALLAVHYYPKLDVSKQSTATAKTPALALLAALLKALAQSPQTTNAD